MTRFSGLRARLTLLLLLAVVPLLILILYNAAETRSSAAREAQSDALRIARFAAAAQAQFIEQTRQVLVSLAGAPELRAPGAPPCADAFGVLQTQYLQQFPRYANLGLIDPDGRIYCSVETVSGSIYIANRDYFQRAMQTLDLSFGDYEHDPATGKTFLSFVYPILDFNGAPRAALFAMLDLAWLNQLADQSQLAAGTTFTLLDRNGKILIRYPDPGRWVGQTLPETPIVDAILTRRAEGTAEATDVDGVQRLYAFTPLAGAAGSAPAAYVSIGIPSDVAYAEGDSLLVRNLVALGLVTALVFGGSIVLGNVVILRPVQALVQATHRLSAGDLSARTGLSITGGQGEIGQLARAFDQMAEAIQQRQIEREQAEVELRASEERYRTLARNFPNGAVILYDHDLRYTVADGAGLAEAGLSKEMLEGKTIWEVFSRDICALLEPHYRSALAGQQAVFETPFARRTYQVYTLPIRDERGDIIAGMAVTQDITERKQAEQALKEKEQQYRSIFEATSDGLVITDIDTACVVEVSPAFCAMHGYARDELIGIDPRRFIHPDSHHVFEEYIDTLRTGRPFVAHAVDVRKDGTPFHVEVRGSRFVYKGRAHSLGMVRDVTERMQAYQLLEQRVAERTRELTTLLEVSRNVASTLELKPLLGLILDQLQSLLDYTGATVFLLEDDELTVLDYRGPMTPERARRLRFRLSQAGVNRAVIEGRAPLIIDDVRGDSELAREFQKTAGADLATRFGYIRSWLGVPLMIKEWTIGMLSIDHSQPGYFTVQHANLALALASQAAIAIENARLYEQAQQLAALEERQKLARELHDSVSQALYGIALGARTARTLLERDPSKVGEPIDYVLSLAEAGLAEMRALIFELRPESLEAEGLVAALTKQAAFVRARHMLEVATAFCDEPPLPLDVKIALYRVAQEALHNVVKHARATRIDLKLECAKESGRIALQVQDNGRGFDAAASFPGHLGLHSMRERAEKIGGRLDVYSASGQGTRVCLTVTLPAEAGEVRSS